MKAFAVNEYPDGKIAVIFGFDGHDAGELRQLQGLLGVAQTMAKSRLSDRIEAAIEAMRVLELRERERDAAIAAEEKLASPTTSETKETP